MLVRRACLRLCGAHEGAARTLNSVQRACGSGAHAGAASMRERRACCGSGAARMRERRACCGCAAHARAPRMRVRRACACAAHAGTHAQECAARMLVRRAC
eukprot:363625-Pleurochrysis_carterae.AAC.1